MYFLGVLGLLGFFGIFYVFFGIFLESFKGYVNLLVAPIDVNLRRGRLFLSFTRNEKAFELGVLDDSVMPQVGNDFSRRRDIHENTTTYAGDLLALVHRHVEHRFQVSALIHTLNTYFHKKQ